MSLEFEFLRKRKKNSSKASSNGSSSCSKLLSSKNDPFCAAELQRLLSATEDEIDEIDSEDEIDPELKAEIVIEDGDDELALQKQRRHSSKV